MEKLRKLLIDNGVIAIVVFVATYSANLWFEKQKGVDSVKLGDSTTIATRANELWDQISKLQSEYSRLDDLRSQQDISIMFDRKPDKTLQTKIDSKAREMSGKHDEVLHAISESSHVIGKPLFQHMALYMSLLPGYYGMRENSRRVRQLNSEEDLSFNEKQVQEIGALLYQMKMDVASTREYALQQANR
jgi:hypothetical protein